MLDIRKAIEASYPSFFQKNPKFITDPFIALLRRLFYEREINAFLEKNGKLGGLEFIEKGLEELNFTYSASKNDIENIPSSGKVLIVANHPLGSLDALSLILLVASVRKDIKVLANELLCTVEPIRNILLPVDNLAGGTGKESVKAILRSLNNEEAIIIFPAGEVSRLRPQGVRDTKWKGGFLHFAKKTNTPILPVFINARNSWYFYMTSMIYKPLASLLLVHEMMNKRNKSLTIKVGELIPYDSMSMSKVSEKTQINLLKRHIYRVAKNKKGVFATQKCIAHPENRQEIKKELNEARVLGSTNDGKKIYLCDYRADSSLMREIGRLREYTFRKVGEGSGKKRDIDGYDNYYKHLVLWDDEDLEVVGAYRLGESNYIMSTADSEAGFYTNSLFNFSSDFEPYLRDSIELGRSFVQPKYWGSRALDYLWFGIGSYLKNNPNIKYMFGPVSISATYPKMARDLLIFFYIKYFGQAGDWVVSKNRYTLSNAEKKELESIFCGGSYIEDFKILKQSLAHLNISVPTLYKQYSELCDDGGVKFLDFGVDPDFENCIDGFILVEVDKVKESKRKRYIGD